MQIEFAVNNSTGAAARYITWNLSPLRLRLLDAPHSANPVAVTLTELRQPNGGSIRFRDSQTTPAKTSLQVSLPANGSSVVVYVQGYFGSASLADGDVSIDAKDANGLSIGTLPLMVRIRKNANKLTPAERNRFLAAMAQLNNRGTGRFTDFRDMHVGGAPDRQAHGGPGFLPWHRAYLLDLERELQLIDPSVALPYWRFDQKSPFLFTQDFIGLPDALGTVQFGAANPLQFWTTDGVLGVNRTPRGIDPATQAASAIAKEAETLTLGSNYTAFRNMEGNPHGFAHTTYFGGSISSPPTAPKDPLFFLLHCNVDRLWAKWQHKHGRFNPADPLAFQAAPPGKKFLDGHNLNDSLWPWNGITTPPRPATAPGGPLASSACVSAPGSSPYARDMLDYSGLLISSAALGFSYDDVH